MPLQNRVTPTGEIVSTPQRGLFTGNRGIIHDPKTKTLLKKRWSSPTWITCVCEFRGWRRKVMGGRSWTELFFLDEATALAAGHRPCFFCRRDLHSSCEQGGIFGSPFWGEHAGGAVEGGQSELIRVPEADGTLVVIPEQLASPEHDSAVLPPVLPADSGWPTLQLSR